MSCWYTFSNSFKIDPPVKDPEDINEVWDTEGFYWQVSEDGSLMSSACSKAVATATLMS